MRLILTAIILCLMTASFLPAADDEAVQALNDARSFADKGEFAKALERHEWYHANALRINRAQYGVRLSFALGYWKKLGEKYPPALASLKKIRDEGARSLEAGTAAPALFNDVEAINRKLPELDATIELFKVLDTKQPKLAKKCFRYAETPLLDAKEFDLFLRYAGNLKEYLGNKIAQHEVQTAAMRTRGQEFKDALKVLENLLIDRTLALSELSSGKGDKAQAAELKAMTAKVVTDPRLASE